MGIVSPRRLLAEQSVPQLAACCTPGVVAMTLDMARAECGLPMLLLSTRLVRSAIGNCSRDD